MHFSIKTLACALCTALGLFLHPTNVLASTEKQAYLEEHISAESKPMLKLYFRSMGKPRSIQKDELNAPQNASAESLALYYFARKYLKRYEGVPLPKDMPDLIEFGKKHHLEWVVAEAQLNKAVTMIEQDDNWNAELLLHDVVSTARDLGYLALEGRAYRWLGNLEVSRNQLRSGLKYYRNAYELLEKTVFEIQVAMTLNNIGTVYIDASDWARANSYLTQALDTYLESEYQYDNSFFMGVIYANLSIVHSSLGDNKKAEYYFNEAIRLSMQTGSDTVKHHSLSSFSQMLSSVGKIDDALMVAQRCVDLPIPKNLEMLKTSCYEAFAEAYLANKQYDKAITTALNVLEQTKSTSELELRQRIDMLSVLVNAHQILNDYEAAFHYLTQLRELEAEFSHHIHGEEMINIKFDLEAKLAQKELKLLETKNALQASELRSQRYREMFYFIAIAAIGVVGFRYVLRVRRINKALTQENTTDPLTQLHNRRYLHIWLDKMARRSPDRTFALAVLDVDHFKTFNDQYGHDIGDKMLTHIATLFNESTRSGDLLIRWGGEEFVLLFEVQRAEDCTKFLERLRYTVENTPLVVDSKPLSATISLGAVDKLSAQTIKQEWDQWFFLADQALYDAKQAGRNQFIIHPTS
ncbi:MULTISPECIES: tetratricopeptide repeat-containing diguanylate cyclase [Vibrio]|uniref:tetratricopeptide repeat-containing diguanylate cyclase n=1 Tax=Vibrio TaxID=662 RepID=UPI000471004A|nr:MULTISPECIES: tetratricopeptide repeat-containing diguanylate cyclase [Vibrio]MBO0134807.1 GGDEF domain-containing protein [Vibrio sp. Vb2736]MBO0196357.1 GGDEF domain-containing protein [Vibrio alginolyticus]MBS9823342.1 GGDEF domain-containing protein [Vibrio alginolyticus]MBS9901531.1 GGDEF domain-containing protein [Vibrio alginolyticus]MCA2420638.1 GGDEF domain-containing protein [Vibrio alginolyticus]